MSLFSEDSVQKRAKPGYKTKVRSNTHTHTHNCRWKGTAIDLY